MSSYDEHLITQAGGDGDVIERLARIQKSNDIWMLSSVTDRTDHDIKFLLALVREQQVRIERGNELVRYLDRLAPGDKHYAGLIRAALGPTP